MNTLLQWMGLRPLGLPRKERPATPAGQQPGKRLADHRLVINREGYILYLILFAVGFAAYNTGNNLLFLFVSIMASLSISHALFNYYSRQGNAVERQIPKTLFAGQPFQVTLRVLNRKKHFSSFSLVLREQQEVLKDTGLAHFVKVMPGEIQERRYTAVITRRGIFQFEGVWLECRFPFGLSTNSMRYDLPEQRVVFPRLIPVHQIRKQESLLSGEVETPFRGSGHSLYSLRDYRPGDSWRLIHWKSSAKRDRLIIKEMEDEERRRLTLLFENTGNPRVEYDEFFECCVSEAASLASHFIHQGWLVELVTLSGRIPMGGGPGHLREMLHHLALIQPVSASAPEARRTLLGQLAVGTGNLLWIQTSQSEPYPDPTTPKSPRREVAP